MSQNNRFIWYLPYYFFIFFSMYLGLKFIFIFFFMTAYVPSFIFDFTPFFMLNGFEYTHLLFLAFTIVFIDMYLHVTLSKKHLRYSLFCTCVLICGMGLRVATVAFSMDFIMHYALFSLLLLVLVIDHRLYLLLPHDFALQTAVKAESITPLPITSSLPKPVSSSFKQMIQTCKISLHHLVTHRSPRSTAASDRSSQKAEIQHATSMVDAGADKPRVFRHPIEEQADKIKTTQQLLSTIGNYNDRFNSIDKNIKQTRLPDKKDQDIFEQYSGSLPSAEPVDYNMYHKILANIQESAVVISRGVVKAVNHSFTDLIGRPTADILDHNFIDFVAPEGFQTFKNHCLQQLGGESSTTFPIVLQTRKMNKIFLNACTKKVMVEGSLVEITIFSHQAT